MSIFECGDFGNQDHDSYGYFVVNAKKYTKKEVLKLYEKEGSFCGVTSFREPLLADIQERFVAHRCRCNDDGETTCGYMLFSKKKSRGCFPVWVIKYDDLEHEEQTSTVPLNLDKLSPDIKEQIMTEMFSDMKEGVTWPPNQKQPIS